MAFRAPVSMEIYGYIERGDEVYHEIVLYENETFVIELEAEDDGVDLDFYLANQDNEVIYKDEERASGAAVQLEVGSTGMFTLYIKAVDGDTNYVLKLQEQG